MLSKEECQGTRLCALEQVVDSMWMLTNALLAQGTQGHVCKRRLQSDLSPCLAWSISLGRHCAQSIIAYRQHKKMLRDFCPCLTLFESVPQSVP